MCFPCVVFDLGFVLSHDPHRVLELLALYFCFFLFCVVVVFWLWCMAISVRGTPIPLRDHATAAPPLHNTDLLIGFLANEVSAGIVGGLWGHYAATGDPAVVHRVLEACSALGHALDHEAWGDVVAQVGATYVCSWRWSCVGCVRLFVWLQWFEAPELLVFASPHASVIRVICCAALCMYGGTARHFLVP